MYNPETDFMVEHSECVFSGPKTNNSVPQEKMLKNIFMPKMLNFWDPLRAAMSPESR